MALQRLFSSHNPLDNIPGATNYINYNSDHDKAYENLRNYSKGFTYNSKYANYLKLMVIPYWVNKNIEQIDYDYMKLKDYSNALTCLTEQDRLSILAMSLLPIDKDGNNLLNIDYTENPLLLDWEASKGENIGISSLYNYNNLIQSYKSLIIKRLYGNGLSVVSESDESDDTYETSRLNNNKPYRFINTTEYIAIVIYEEFYNYLSNKETKLIFFQDLLKEIYTKIPLVLLVTDHRYANIFNQYLNLLA